MNKRGIVLDFIVTILLAIIIFGSAFAVMSKIFSTGEQGQKSFVSFKETIEKMPDSPDRISQLLILDEESFIMAYNPEKNLELCTQNNACGVSYYPKECDGKACLCLCKSIQTSGFEAEGSLKEDITCVARDCKSVPRVTFKSGLSVSNFYYTADESLSVPNFKNGYFKNGFILARSPISFGALTFNFANIRRQFFSISSVDDEVYLCNHVASKENKCHFRDDFE